MPCRFIYQFTCFVRFINIFTKKCQKQDLFFYIHNKFEVFYKFQIIFGLVYLKRLCIKHYIFFIEWTVLRYCVNYKEMLFRTHNLVRQSFK